MRSVGTGRGGLFGQDAEFVEEGVSARDFGMRSRIAHDFPVAESGREDVG